MGLLSNEGMATSQKILFCSELVKRKFPARNCPHFPGKIDDFDLNCCIVRVVAKSSRKKSMGTS